MDETPDMCPNCHRPLDARECADPAHRAARGCTPTDTKYECAWCHKDKSWVDFYAKGRLMKVCKKCRFTARVRRNSKRHARNLVHQHEVNTYWEKQAARHS